jgi:hypothetical protein
VFTGWISVHEPLEIFHTRNFGDSSSPEEWRVTYEDVKPRIGALEYLCKLDWPVKWNEWLLMVPSLFEPTPVALSLITSYGAGIVSANCLAFFRLLCTEMGGDYKIPE